VLTVLAMLFIGGRYTMWGVLVSAPILWAIHILLPPSIVRFTNLFYGALLVIILVTRPEGIISREMLQKITAWIKSWSGRAKPVAASPQDPKDAN
jgi:ABC-type branched-subunit amino acid transport system permease subunit